MSRIVLCFLVGLTLAVSGCVSRGPVAASPDIEMTDLDALPEPTITPTTIGPEEQLEVSVANSEMLSGKYLTDGLGRLDFPLIGLVDANGLSPNELASAIERRLDRRYLVNPQVRVLPTSMTPPSITVGGEVNKPGTYQANQSPTLLRAVYNAGGLAEYADSKEVLILRNVDGRKYIGVYDVNGIERGNYGDPRVFPGDVIAVGDSPQRRNLDRILGTIPVFTSIAVLLTRL